MQYMEREQWLFNSDCVSSNLEKALKVVRAYIYSNFSNREIEDIEYNISRICGVSLKNEREDSADAVSYIHTQDVLSKINEKESIRKKKGVYYTPNDVVHFIVINTVKESLGYLSSENFADDILHIKKNREVLSKTVFDPTCGAGEFLLEAANFKIEILKHLSGHITKESINSLVSSIYGNDINFDSIVLSKLRIYLAFLDQFGTELCSDLPQILNKNFTAYDFILESGRIAQRFDIIIGNPPYVEDNKSGLPLQERYGNIYANVLCNSERLLKQTGCIGFVIPLSYISTSRMKVLRDKMLQTVKKQYILSYADRPDCLFDSVHQKLCIVIGCKKAKENQIYTSNYRYWYSSERRELFKTTKVIRNPYQNDDGIPKFGTEMEKDIYDKIMDKSRLVSIYNISRNGDEAVYLNRRETFWMKAYRTTILDPEYKVFRFKNKTQADLCYCIINSSLFWWYWTCTSDCWHVSKTLNGFLMPRNISGVKSTALANSLQARLEETKKYVGTKQTEYEYKHKECLKEIERIDDYINALYELSKEESAFIKKYALRYRIGDVTK